MLTAETLKEYIIALLDFVREGENRVLLIKNPLTPDKEVKVKIEDTEEGVKIEGIDIESIEEKLVLQAFAKTVEEIIKLYIKEAEALNSVKAIIEADLIRSGFEVEGEVSVSTKKKTLSFMIRKEGREVLLIIEIEGFDEIKRVKMAGRGDEELGKQIEVFITEKINEYIQLYKMFLEKKLEGLLKGIQLKIIPKTN